MKRIHYITIFIFLSPKFRNSIGVYDGRPSIDALPLALSGRCRRAPRQPLDLRALAHAHAHAHAHAPQVPPAVAARRAPARRRRAARPPPDPAAERRAFERWRHEVLRRPDDDDERSSEDNELSSPPPAPARPSAEPAPQPDDDPPVTNDGYEADPETEDRRPGSGDDDAASTGSGSASASSSSPTADVDEPDDGDDRDDRDDRDRSPPRDRAEPARGDDSPAPVPRGAPPVDVPARPARARREAGETPRRGDRSRAFESGSRPATAKHHARKDKVSKRRERPAASPPRSPARGADARAPGPLLWGASWSSVVAARGAGGGTGAAGPAPLAPIGSDVRRRAEPAPADNSLFYFNGDPTHTPPRDPDFTWRPPPQVDRPTFSPSRDFLDEGAGVGNGSFHSLNSVWGSTLEPRPAAAAWLWGGLGAGAEGPAVRPPPGFGAPARPVRPYDPFRSLASIWAPGALDWRADSPPPGPGAPDEPAAHN